MYSPQVGLHKFLPRSVLNGMKPKALRKLIQQHFKKVAALSELECMFKFFDLLRAYYRFDQERFICALGVSKQIHSTSFRIRLYLSYSYSSSLSRNFQSSWSIPVELVIGPDLGISYMAHRGGTVVRFQIVFSHFVLSFLFVDNLFVVFPRSSLSHIFIAADQDGGILSDTIDPDIGLGLQGTCKSLYQIKSRRCRRDSQHHLLQSRSSGKSRGSD